MAGFGDSGGGMSKKKKGKNSKPNKSPILKPKAQWDRYGSLKKSTGVRATARVANDGQDSGEWYEVGRVKSEGDEYTEIAVALQRGIIAEHAKRLYPLQVSAILMDMMNDFVNFMCSISARCNIMICTSTSTIGVIISISSSTLSYVHNRHNCHSFFPRIK